jgi:hypothetical protein
LITPASSVNRTVAGRPSAVDRTSALRTPVAQSGYAVKSAMTAMMSFRGIPMMMLDVVLSVMHGAYLAVTGYHSSA